jgi:hypothetical protein
VSAETYTEAMLLGIQGYDGYVCKLYRTTILSHTRFNETLKFSEDTDFLLRVLRQDLRVYISSFVGYFYSQDTSGVTRDTSGEKRLKSLALSESFVREASNDKMRSAAQCYYWRNAYYILSQSSISPENQKTTWGAIKKYRMFVITNKLSPLKYRLIAVASLLGKAVFVNVASRLVRTR